MTSLDFIGATVDLAFDYEKMAREVCACEEFFIDTPPRRRVVEGGLSGEIPFMSESAENYRRIDTLTDEEGIERKALRGTSIFYLRNSKESDVIRDARFVTTKKAGHASWFWRPEVAERIPYTIGCIESLPYRTVGLVRAFVYRDTFLPVHRDTIPDTDGPGAHDRGKTLGLSLVPATGGVGMLIWDEAGRLHELRGQSFLFDDSRWHGLSMTKGLRITLRIFGELDHGRLSEHLVETIPP
jgi:hypothetical protein